MAVDAIFIFTMSSSGSVRVKQALAEGRDIRIDLAVGFLKKRFPEGVDIGVVCGSGLSGLSNLVKNPTVVPYASIPAFPVPTVAGHKGELVFGELGGKRVMLMKGRFHTYEGYKARDVSCCFDAVGGVGIV